MKSSKTGIILGKTITYIALVLLALSIIVPVGWVFFASVKENSEFYRNPWTLPKGFHYQNFIDAFEKANMQSFFLNSIIVTAIALAFLLVIALPAAYVLSRYKFKGQKFLNVCFMAGIFVNLSYLVVPIFLMLSEADKFLSKTFGIKQLFLNNHIILSLVYASTSLAFTIFLLSSYFKTLPKDFEEAAYVDGASYFRTMVSIMFPMAKPSILTVILFQFLAYWNEYALALTLMADEKKYTLSVGLLNLMNAQKAAATYGQLYAGLVVVMLPTFILYMLVQKQLTQGMTAGGVKG